MPIIIIITFPILPSQVLTPQHFGNVDESLDIFNHSNRHFWEAMIPGLTAWGMVVCTGSNLLLRADALHDVGNFPSRTITEDYALGLALGKRGYTARYLPRYLALGVGASICAISSIVRDSMMQTTTVNAGEAPEEGAIFRQRSRWCKGHLQVAES